jgi:Gpi18-like mannosyltransferase
MGRTGFFEVVPPWQVLLLFGAAFFLRLFFAPFEGFKQDIQDSLLRGQYSAEHGVTHTADLVAGTDIPTYPPLAIYQGCAISRIGTGRMARLQAQYPQVAEVWKRVRFKLLAISYDLLTGLLILLVLSQFAAAPWPLWGAALYLLNPCVWINSAWFGQTDAVHSFYMFFCVLCLGMGWSGQTDGWLAAAWVIFGLGVCAKLQTILILPLLGWATLLRRKPGVIVGSMLAGLLTVVVLYSPFLLARRWDYFDHVFLKSFTFYNFTQVNAFSIWALGPVLPAKNKILGISYAQMGDFLALASLCWLLLVLTRNLQPDLRTRDNLRKLVVAGAYECLALFVLLTNMHERYIAPAIALLVLAGCLDRRLLWLAAGFSLTYTLNLLYVLWQTGTPADGIAVRNACSFAIRVFGTLLNVGMVGWLTIYLPELLAAPAPCTPDPEKS